MAHLTEFPPPLADSDASWLPIVSASALIFFAYMGFEDIANIAEEAENPAQTLPKAFIYALLISTVIYILVAIVAVSVVPFAELAKAEQPLSMIMSKLVGGYSPELIALVALFATANTVLITLIVCARMMYGMAKSDSLPRVLSTVHKTRQTPYIAIMITGFISIIFLFFKKVEVLAAISDVGIFILFFVVNLSNIVLRYRRPDIQRTWRSPLNIGRLPVISVLGVLSCAFMLVNINHPVHLGDKTYSAQVVGICIFALAIPLSFIFSRKPKS